MNTQVVSQLFVQIFNITKNIVDSKEKELKACEKQIDDYINV